MALPRLFPCDGLGDFRGLDRGLAHEEALTFEHRDAPQSARVEPGDELLGGGLGGGDAEEPEVRPCLRPLGIATTRNSFAGDLSSSGMLPPSDGPATMDGHPPVRGRAASSHVTRGLPVRLRPERSG